MAGTLATGTLVTGTLMAGTPSAGTPDEQILFKKSLTGLKQLRPTPPSLQGPPMQGPSIQ